MASDSLSLTQFAPHHVPKDEDEGSSESYPSAPSSKPGAMYENNESISVTPYSDQTNTTSSQQTTIRLRKGLGQSPLPISAATIGSTYAWPTS